jgi:hypothetical protein
MQEINISKSLSTAIAASHSNAFTYSTTVSQIRRQQSEHSPPFTYKKFS